MNGSNLVRKGRLLLLASLLAPAIASALMPTNPQADRDFMRLPDGSNMADISVNGEKLSLARGMGNAFDASKQAAYRQIKTESMRDPDHKVQWTMMDLDSHRVIAQSLSANKRMFGASVAKVYVASTLLNKQLGAWTPSQLQLMSSMLVVSSNTAWTELQRQIGGGDADEGREEIYNFTQKMGYLNTRGWQGSWGSRHGNELTVADLAELMHDTYKGRYKGAETFWKLMHTCRTGSSRARKYIPTSIFVGGKTGTYDGPTTIDGVNQNVKSRNHIVVFNVQGREYALTILADTGSDESSALLAGGLIREYAGLAP